MTTALSSQHTENLPEVLQQLGLSIIVTTYQAGQLIIIRELDGQVNTHYTAMERPMGLAHFNNRMAIGGAYQTVEYFNVPDAGKRVQGPAQHDACYVPRNVHYTGDIDIHEMAYGDEGLWIVNTKMSCLCTIDDDHSFTPRWRPPFVTAYDLNDRCHLNGVAMMNGKPVYVTALGETDTGGEWRLNKADGGLMMDIRSDEIVGRGLSMPHSPRWHMNQLWFLESGNGSLATLDPKTGEKQTITELPGFTRGLSFAGRYAIIGLSQVRETAVFAGLPLTEREASRNCGVWIVDTQTGQIVSFLTFTGEVQEIFAVGILPARVPTLLTPNDPLVRTTYSLPDEALKNVAPPDPALLTHEQALQAYSKKDFDEATRLLKEVVEQKPEFNQAKFHLGVVYVDAEQWENAITVLNEVLERDPKQAEALNSLGMAHCGLHQWREALDAFDRSVAIDRTFSRAQFNRSIVLFKLGDYPGGWEAFEWRWRLPEFTPFRCPQPQWTGEDVADKTLLVHTEQGSGDAIQMARFLPDVAKHCKKLILVGPEPLKELLGTVPDIDEIRLPGNMPADLFDVYIPIMSLGHVLGINLENCSTTFPYLSVPEHISVPTLKGTQSRKIGLCWRGSPGHKNNHHRSCPLEQWVALTEGVDADFYGLNIGLSGDERKLLEAHGIQDLDTELAGFARTAAYFQQLDLVISVDTVSAHLAGALNIPTWVLLNANPDWRWGLEGDSTHWYPSFRIFRQENLDDWADQLRAVRDELNTPT